MLLENDILNGINKEFNNINDVREQLFETKKIQLNSNVENFTNPNAYGVYKTIGGSCLGVVGDKYIPSNLNVLLDSIVTSVYNSNNNLDLSTLEFKEYKQGAKVCFSIDLPVKELKRSKLVGDIVERKIEFRTGFDGKTKTSIVETFNRLWCSNGCTNTKSQQIAFKNTINNRAKIYNLANYITLSELNSNEFITNIDKLNDVEVSPKEIDNFISSVTGYNLKDFKEISTRGKNIIEKINECIFIESENTGYNMFSLVNGITRYTTHIKAEKSEEKLYYSTASKINNDALKHAFSFIN